MEKCICNHKKTIESFTIKVNEMELIYARCNNCLSYRMMNPLNTEEILEYYNKEKPTRVSADFRKALAHTANEDFKALKQYNTDHVCRGKRLLDIGCSEGTFVQVTAQRKYDAYGIDIATELIAYGKERGVALEVADYLSFNKQSWDIITLHDVLVHVYQPR